MRYRFDELTPWLRPIGRTLLEDRHGWFFNWSCSGFRLRFHGSRLLCEMEAFEDPCYFGEHDNLPVVAAFADGAAEPLRMIRLSRGKAVYTLFESESAGNHEVVLQKRSENAKGRNAFLSVETDGALLPLPAKDAKRRRIEFIGDSITCGFGLDMDPKESTFSTESEDGMAAYAGVAARLLNADYHSVCISGIPLCWSPDPSFRLRLPDNPDFEPAKRTMEDYYPYTDRWHEEACGIKSNFTQWDFNAFRPDAIVVNLGTNDAFRVTLSASELEERHFCQRYLAFLHTLRALNGDRPLIVCTLGSMDYYLYDAILRAVYEYRANTGDARVYCMKFFPINEWCGEMGGLGHPSRLAQQRMGRELAQLLTSLLEEGATE